MEITKQQIIHTDVLIIGGGTAGCYAALTIREKSDAKIVIAEKANIKRSGCLAAGVNAINAYIVKGRKPQDYVDYARKDADEIVRGDLLLTMSEHLNEVTSKMEQLGLVILKDENGDYVARGNRNIKINGENIKPILADAVNQLDNVEVINHLNITDYIVEDNTIKGAFGFHMENGTAYEIRAKKVLCATGGAAGLYKPNNPGFSRHKMWYPPFNTGAGYAMGIDAGAEMTTFEMRFIALRCKDTIAPTGTIAQGVGARNFTAADVLAEIEDAGLTYPLFVKPSRAGSSFGVTKVEKADDRETQQDRLAAAIATAGEHDWKVLVEQGIDGREIECAVLCPKAGDEPEASWPGEIVLDHQNDDQFYDFDSKYMDASASHVEVPANLPVSVLEDVRDVARRAFKAVDGAGLSRVDTFVTPDGTVMVNEINTMPGFTPISMYPKAWDATGVSYTELITRLIEGVLR